jgi:hypothetical protein
MAPRPPNYNQARGDRNRAKQEKKQERLRRREEDSLRRKAERPPETGAGADESAEAVPPPASPSSPESLPDLKNPRRERQPLHWVPLTRSWRLLLPLA